MSILGALGGALGLKDLVLGVLDRIKLNPQEKAKVELQMSEQAQELAKFEMELKKAAMEIQAKEIETASANIRAEAMSQDKVVSRARPFFLYVIYIVLIFNYIAIPIVQLIKGAPQFSPIILPDELYWLFGCGYLGYTGFRSLDKKGFKFNSLLPR